jgi:serine/threonine-protein kinase
MLPPEALDPAQYGPVGRAIDVYHIGLVLLSVLLGRIPSFTNDEILGAGPRLMAEALPSPYATAIGMALRRHANDRPTIAQLWQLIVDATPDHLRPV